jgi:hypothetical protein
MDYTLTGYRVSHLPKRPTVISCQSNENTAKSMLTGHGMFFALRFEQK